MNLIVFDCDDTLWKLPYIEDNYYMSLPESLNYDFEYKHDIIRIYNDKKKNSENKFVILSNRCENVKTEILDKLKKDINVDFDYTLFRIDDRDKSNRLKSLIEELKNIKKVEFYDDKTKHIKSIKKLKNEYCDIKFKTFKV
jgi:hypothetical protein